MTDDIEHYEGFPDYFKDVSGFDYFRDPTIIMKKAIRVLEKLPIICKQCHDYKKIRYTPRCVTILCKCECLIIYPPKKNRNYNYLWVRIPKEDYDAGRKNTRTTKKSD